MTRGDETLQPGHVEGLRPQPVGLVCTENMAVSGDVGVPARVTASHGESRRWAEKVL